jgi:hypothetical protein
LQNQAATRQTLKPGELIVSVALTNRMQSLINSPMTSIFIENGNIVSWTGLNDRLHAFINYFVIWGAIYKMIARK